MNNKQTMRDAFIENVHSAMKNNDTIMFLSADFGAPLLDDLRMEHKDRFINVGIAEQNLINVATGLALEGMTVFCYAIAPFLSMRSFEQIRINLAMLSQLRPLNVNLIGVGAGLSYDVSGPTHHCLEDLGIMRMLPNIEVISPADWVTAKAYVSYTLSRKTPKYLRFDGKPLPSIYQSFSDEDIHRGFVEIRKGESCCLLSTGYMTHKALRIAEILDQSRHPIGVVDIFSLKNVQEDLLVGIMDKYRYIITLEEGFTGRGGLDSYIGEMTSRNNLLSLRLALGFENKYIFEIGDREFLYKQCGLDDDSIVARIRRVLED